MSAIVLSLLLAGCEAPEPKRLDQLEARIAALEFHFRAHGYNQHPGWPTHTYTPDGPIIE